MNLRQKYIQDYGLVIPEGEGHHTLKNCCKGESPELHEILLMSRPHQWPLMRLLQQETFDSFMNLVTKYESRIFKALNLPAVNDIRISIIKGFKFESKTPNITSEELKEMDGILAEWSEDTTDNVYKPQMLAVFTATVNRVRNDVIEALPREFTDLVIQRGVEPNLDDVFLSSVVSDAVRLD